MRHLPKRARVLANIVGLPRGTQRLRATFQARLSAGETFSAICESLRLPYCGAAEAIGFDRAKGRFLVPPAPPAGAWKDFEGMWHVPANDDGKTIRFYCPACKKTHAHGSDGQAVTHRSSHCFAENSPIRAGYMLHISEGIV
jgi:cytochrome c1